jgi:hypothetical protein
MKNLHKLGIAALALAIVFSFAACASTGGGGGSSPPNTDPKTLVITGISKADLDKYFPAGKENMGLYSPGNGPDKGGNSFAFCMGNPDTILEGGTYTITLTLMKALVNNVWTGDKWTGNGTYDVYVDGSFPSGAIARNVVFNQAVTTVAWGKFSKISR